MGNCSGCGKKKEKPVGIDKLKSILEGWKNVAWSSPRVEQIATERAVVCAECDCNDKGWCELCGCPIIAKARSLSEICDDGKWDEIDKKYNL